jgi:putative membrane protein
MMYGRDGGWDGGQWIAMAFMMLVFWGVVVAAVVALVRRPTVHGVGEPPRPLHHDSERILGERFARGEIDEAEFTSRRDILRRGH